MKEVKMRRYQNLLTVSGLGMIVFALWSVLKTILLFCFNEKLLAEVPDDTLFRVILFSIIGFILLFDFLMRLFVGLSARAEGFGKKKGNAYIVVAVLIALGSLASLVMIFFDSSIQSIIELIVSVIVEATSLIVVIELLVAAYTVKKLKKELKEE
ncbi:MAG: hypothetical protein IJS94_04510 [Clostridia bacterium]|nr:hypothetical protein [Clostridia bacterium]